MLENGEIYPMMSEKNKNNIDIVLKTLLNLFKVKLNMINLMNFF
jgi:hypothetical protein